MPVSGPFKFEKEGQVHFQHPASIFLKKQQDLISKGYTEEKAF